MDRLTKRRPDGRVGFAGNGSPTENAFMIPNVLNRLAAYEDTGLEPEDILTAKESAEIACALNELKKYKDAELEGRLVVLPCKVGETVWFVGTECDKNDCWEYSDYCHRGCEKLKTPKIRETTIRQFCLKGNQFDLMTDTDALYSSTSEYFYLRDICKTVFLTREEAEAALEKMKGEQNGSIDL